MLALFQLSDKCQDSNKGRIEHPSCGISSKNEWMLQQHDAYQTRWVLEQCGVNLTGNTCRWHLSKHTAPQESACDFSLFIPAALYGTFTDTKNKNTIKRRTLYEYIQISIQVKLENFLGKHSSHTHTDRKPTPMVHKHLHKHIEYTQENSSTRRDVCVRWQRVWFVVAASADSVWQHSSGTTLQGTVKLTSWGGRRRGWREEDNKVQTIYWEAGKVWGNIIQSPGKQWNYIYSKQLFHWQHFHWEHYWQLLVSYFSIWKERYCWHHWELSMF